MSKHLCVLAAAVMLLLNGAAVAHSWYPKECCHDKECRPVPCAELHYDGDSVRYGRIYFSKRMIRQSHDEGCHVCYADPMGSIIPSVPFCVFVPQATS